MQIVLNAGGATWLGGRYYLENLARAIGTLAEDERPELVVTGDAAFPDALARAVDGIPPDADVVFPNWGLHGLERVAQLHWIPDLQHRALPQNFSRMDRLRRDIGYRRLARRAHLVVVSSEAVRRAAASAYPRTASKLRVLHFRTVVPREVLDRDPRAAVASHGLPENFILLPNQWWAHKNHATALAALSDLPFPLVCTGEPTDHRRPGYAERLLDDVRGRDLADRLHVLGVVPRADYLDLVRAARAILQPSLFEGWSSIVEDARAFGKPIALSDIPVHREQDPPHGFFFEAEDPRALAGAVEAAVDRGDASEADARRERETLAREYARQFIALAREARAAL